MQNNLVLHKFTYEEKKHWQENILPKILEDEDFKVVYTISEIDLNYTLVQENKAATVLYFLTKNTSQDRDFIFYLTQILKVPVLILHRNLEEDEYSFFELGIEDIVNLNADYLTINLLKRKIKKAWYRQIARKNLERLEKSEKEGILLREPKILVIEDDEDTLQGIINVFTNHGYQVFTANSVAQSLMEFSSKRPDLILADYQLPDGTAMDIFENLHSHPQTAEIPLVIMTAEENQNWWQNLFFEVEDVIQKPIAFHKLEHRIRKILQKNLELRKCKTELAELDKFVKASKPFLPPDIQKRIKEDFSIKLYGHIQFATVAFFDLRNSTALGDRLDAAKFAEILNSILHDVMDLAVSHKGSVNKLLGDGLMLTFGAPDVHWGTPEDAVRFAFSLKEHFTMLNSVDAFSLKEKINYGLGISTGRVFAGNLGSIHRMEFTVMGDVVNTASRLEGLNKKIGTNILIDDTTYQKIPQDLQNLFQPFQVQIRGKGNERFLVWGNKE